MFKQIMTLVACAAIVSACASKPYAPTPFDRQASGVNTVRVIEDAAPAEPVVRKLATTGGNMASAMGSAGLAGAFAGLIVAGVEASVAANQQARLRAALASQQFDAEAVFDRALEETLKGQSLQVETLAIARDPKVRVLPIKADAGAAGAGVLDVQVLAYGYQLVGGVGIWRPFVDVKVRMVDAVDPTKVLLDNAVTYNAVAPLAQTITIAADDAYGFDKIENVESDPKKAAEGLTKALEAAAQAAGKLAQ